MNACIDPQARICLLRYVHAQRKGLTDKPCHSCEPAAQVMAYLGTSKTLAAPVEVPLVAAPQPLPVSPVVGMGLDKAVLRKILRPILNKQDKPGQKSVYIDRIQALYNADLPVKSRITAKKRFREALEKVVGLNVEGSYLLLDRDAWKLCAGS